MACTQSFLHQESLCHSLLAMLVQAKGLLNAPTTKPSHMLRDLARVASSIDGSLLAMYRTHVATVPAAEAALSCGTAVLQTSVPSDSKCACAANAITCYAIVSDKVILQQSLHASVV